MSEYDLEIALRARELWQAGKRELRWSNRPTSAERPWVEGWADVYIPDFCEVLDLNWLLTIADPEDEMIDDEGYVQVARDAYLLFRFADDDLIKSMTYLAPGRRERVISPQKSDYKFYYTSYKKEEYRESDATYRVPVWSAERIASVTSDWLKELSGHRFDLLLDEKIESPIETEIRETMERIDSGEEETFDLGDGLFASEGVFDFLLSDPDQAGQITEEMKRIVGDKREDLKGFEDQSD